MKKRILLASLFPFLLISCSTTPKYISPTISNYVVSREFSKYRKLAVLPFVDAPGAPQSGQIIQGLAIQILAQSGFIVVNDALGERQLSLGGPVDRNQIIRIGKLLEIDAIVVGEVGQYSVMPKRTGTVYFPVFLFGQIAYLPTEGKQWTESYVSISLRVIDVDTSQLIYSGSGQYDEGLSNPPQQLGEYILRDIIERWVGNPSQAHPNQIQKIEKHQQEIEIANRQIQLSPKAGYAYFNRGYAFFELGEYNRAIVNYNKVIDLEPRNGPAYFNRGLAYEKLGNREQALEDFKTSAKLGNNNAQDYLRSKRIDW